MCHLSSNYGVRLFNADGIASAVVILCFLFCSADCHELQTMLYASYNSDYCDVVALCFLKLENFRKVTW